MVSDSQIDRIKNIKLGVCIMKENVKERKRTRMYRVWHTDKKICSKFDEKQISKVTASNVKEAKQKVLEMFPGHRVTSVWLIEK